ncbi:MAG: hypothetical protein ABSF65_01995 [Candidatus Bathyarchaeia archaeon]|jgi:hypothetical protein
MKYTNFSVVKQDEEGIYFDVTDEKGTVTKARPEQFGFKKEESWRIYVYKTIQNPDKLQDEQVFFSMTLTFAFPIDEPKKWINQYFYKARSGRIMLRDFEAGICSEVSINSELVTRGKAVKLPENSLVPKNAPIFRLSASGELEREIQESSIW